jgi:lipoic acid synthetase/lipoate-protein ligase A
MKYVSLPTAEAQLTFYLAMEEYVAHHVLPAVGRFPSGEPADCFFMWQVRPTVIYGRNQVVENEVNLDYCRAHGIEVVHRKSGGGCVYADQDNLMLSFITREANVSLAFNRFVNMLLLVLHKMGIEAVSTAHNDVMIGDRKVCGTACYHTGRCCIVHSTMLYDTNMDHMLHAITPSREKLQKKGIESVRQRITLLKDHTTLSLDEIKSLIRDTLCDGELRLTAQDVEEINIKKQQYGN